MTIKLMNGELIDKKDYPEFTNEEFIKTIEFIKNIKL